MLQLYVYSCVQLYVFGVHSSEIDNMNKEVFEWLLYQKVPEGPRIYTYFISSFLGHEYFPTDLQSDFRCIISSNW